MMNTLNFKILVKIKVRKGKFFIQLNIIVVELGVPQLNSQVRDSVRSFRIPKMSLLFSSNSRVLKRRVDLREEHIILYSPSPSLSLSLSHQFPFLFLTTLGYISLHCHVVFFFFKKKTLSLN